VTSAEPKWKFPPGPREASAAPAYLPFAWVYLKEMQPHLWWLFGRSRGSESLVPGVGKQMTSCATVQLKHRGAGRRGAK